MLYAPNLPLTNLAWRFGVVYLIGPRYPYQLPNSTSYPPSPYGFHTLRYPRLGGQDQWYEQRLGQGYWRGTATVLRWRSLADLCFGNARRVDPQKCLG